MATVFALTRREKFLITQVVSQYLTSAMKPGTILRIHSENRVQIEKIGLKILPECSHLQAREHGARCAPLYPVVPRCAPLSPNRGNLVRFAHIVSDNGADLVLGHGPHVPRALELRNQKLIAYSLGNFLGYRTLSTQGPLGTSMILQIGLDAQGNFVHGRIIPVALDPNGMPYLDDYFRSVIWVRNLTQQDFPDTPLMIDDEGYI
jgi:hypothetical protein